MRGVGLGRKIDYWEHKGSGSQHGLDLARRFEETGPLRMGEDVRSGRGCSVDRVGRSHGADCVANVY